MLYLFGLVIAVHAAQFTDADLATALRGPCSGPRACVFYFWSPHMPLSVKGREAAQHFATEKKYKLYTLLDPMSGPHLAEEVRRARHWPADTTTVATAPTFIKRGIRVHYPSYLFATKGRLAGPLIPGVRASRELASLARRYSK